ncbi:MAG: alpha-L-fucosidase [Candidatus Aminicenantes bacterium]|nr:alpha-L-fucosidase [Candidatus Aminicenantes bacterium]
MVAKAARVVPSPRQFAWQKREFIAFAHFGMNTFTGREWGEGTEDPALFNPTAFDARQWARVVKAAGMAMIIVTAKHHDGFCLWPSRFTDHSVRSSPWRGGEGDVVGEVSAACREAGLAFGVYLSPWDRHEPSFGDSPRYNEYFRAQLRELLTQYGPVAEVWFDGANGEGPNGKRQEYDWPSTYALVRELQPEAVIAIMGPDVRWVGTESGYGRETEWSVLPANWREEGAFGPRDMTGPDLGGRERLKEARALFWYPAETDVSTRPGWFYHSDQDGQVKTPEKLVDIYYSSVGRNGVLLLNIPPDRRGLIHEADAGALLGMRRTLEATFAVNLAAGAGVRASSEQPGHPAAALLDADSETYWAAAEDVTSAEITFDLAVEAAFDRALLQEEVRVGQRLEAFSLEAWDGAAWRSFAEGTTVGYKRLLRFPPVIARKIRLVIRESRLNPTLAVFGLYLAPKG